MLCIHFCEEVDIHSVRILNNRMMANCDGIDPDHCKHVRITNCHIEAADDCIVLKTTEANSQYGDCEDILISNCTLASTSAAIKIGTESVNDFRPCSGPSFQEGKIHGIYVKNAKDVTVRNIKVTVQEEMQEWVDRDIGFENAVVNE